MVATPSLNFATQLQISIGCLLISASVGIGFPHPALAQSSSPPQATPPIQLEDCGTDEACLLKNAGVCRPTQAQITRSLEMIGIATNSPTLMQIWGMQGESCVMYTEALSSREGFSSVMNEELQSSNLSPAMMEILQRNRVKTTCLFESPVGLSQLLQIVTEQQQGTVDLFSTGPEKNRLLVNGRQVALCQTQRSS